MSTNALVGVTDRDGPTYWVFRHWDGNPASVIQDMESVVPFVWELPRFEADEFAAGIVAAWKGGPGNIRLVDHPEEWGVEYKYELRMVKDNLHVKVIGCPYEDHENVVVIFDGLLTAAMNVRDWNALEERALKKAGIIK